MKSEISSLKKMILLSIASSLLHHFHSLQKQKFFSFFVYANPLHESPLVNLDKITFFHNEIFSRNTKLQDTSSQQSPNRKQFKVSARDNYQ
jgi:hypothetical protein